jgi:Icc-related predicted phosphoesterase
LIKSLDIKAWIHGHIHHACDYKIGETRIVVNPVSPGNFTKNDLSKVIEV